MGGFGALRIGAKYATRFQGISAHSAITHFEQMADFVEEDLDAFDAPAGDRSVLDAMLIAKNTLPPIRFDCGESDPLLEANRALHRRLSDAGISHHYEEFPGGHEWAYWEKHIEQTLRFFDDSLNQVQGRQGAQRLPPT
jgi:S-formylglutathione hydrolase FrmB